MANTTYPDIVATQSWVDYAATRTELASADVTLQMDAGTAQIAFAGGSEPAAGISGHKLASGDSITGNAANLWVKTANSGVLSVSVAS